MIRLASSARWLIPAIIALALLAVASSGHAQQLGGAPPTILDFTASLQSISVEDAEAGRTPATLAWHTTGITGEYRLVLQTYTQRSWQSLTDPNGVPLDPNGLYIVRVENTCGFCPPTYRLAIINTASQIVDQRVVSIPFEQSAAAPVIAQFSTGVQRVEANALAQRTARIPVFWQVSNRQPNSNLVFDQVLETGASVAVEEPRSNLWVPSSGQGETVPAPPQSENFITLRLRVVDMIDGQVFDEQTITIPVIGTITTPIVNPDRPPVALVGNPEPLTGVVDTGPTQVQLHSFTVTPATVNRGDTVTVAWNVSGARSMMVSRLNPLAEFADFYPAPGAVGTWTVTLPDDYVDTASFYLVAVDQNDNQVSSTISVNILCPYTYFFQIASPAACPLSGYLDVEAVFQPFERGYMIWRGDTRQMVVLLQNQTFLAFPDTYVDGEPIDILSAVPAGLTAPQGRFAKVWLEQVDVMGGLGWATGPEQPYSMRVQQSGAFRDRQTFFTWPDGSIVEAVHDRWSFVTQQ